MDCVRFVYHTHTHCAAHMHARTQAHTQSKLCCSLFDLWMDFLLFLYNILWKSCAHKSGVVFFTFLVFYTFSAIQFIYQRSNTVLSRPNFFFRIFFCTMSHWWRNISDKNVSFQKLSIEIAQLRSIQWWIFFHAKIKTQKKGINWNTSLQSRLTLKYIYLFLGISQFSTDCKRGGGREM